MQILTEKAWRVIHSPIQAPYSLFFSLSPSRIIDTRNDQSHTYMLEDDEPGRSVLWSTYWDTVRQT